MKKSILIYTTCQGNIFADILKQHKRFNEFISFYIDEYKKQTQGNYNYEK